MVRRPGILEICLQALTAALILLWLFELYQASQAIACVEGAVGPNCYPWGPAGRGAEVWTYLSKELYIVHLVVLIQFLAIGAVLPFLTSSPSSYLAGLALLVWIYLCGYYAVSIIIY